MVKRKFRGYSSAFWFGHRYDMCGNLDFWGGSAFNSVCEKRFRSGLILSKTTNMAAQRAVLCDAFKSRAREGGRDTRGLQRAGRGELLTGDDGVCFMDSFCFTPLGSPAYLATKAFSVSRSLSVRFESLITSLKHSPRMLSRFCDFSWETQ